MGSVRGIALFCALSPALAVAAPKADRAELSLARGRYAEAERAFRQHHSARSRLGLARVLSMTGRYAEAERTARRAARGRQRPAALTVAAQALRARGRLAAAEKLLRGVTKRSPGYYRARAMLALVYREQGKAAEAKALFDTFYDDYGGGKLDKSSAEQLTYVGMACRYTDNFRDASDTFRDATQADPKHVEAWIQWAEISLEKYEAGYAEQHFKRALKINPHHPDALVGLARVELTRSNDVRSATKLLRDALKVNPHHVDARVVLAQILVDDERYRAADKLLNTALKTNPRHLGALSMLAASHFLRDDERGFARLKKKVLRLNPHHSGLFHTVVKLAVRHHRYREAIALGQEAIKIDPEDWYSLADLGTNYLRMGDDKRGVKYLKQAWRGDRFNVRNFNLLNLYDDVLSKHYTFVKTRHFRLRVHESEKDLIKRIAGPLLERAYARYVRKYKFVPKGPIIVEMYKNPQHYAIRTVGLPSLAALGVCFGRVITTTSPTLGRFNWAQVLWHELNHVFTIQLSRSRVPRWLTEGLADLEPTLVRSEWRRENDFDIYKALVSGRLHGLASMNSSFTRARNIFDMVVAYYQGSLMAAYLVKHWGLPKVLRGLKQYGRGKRTAEVIPAITGLSLDQLDERFRQAQLKRLAYYRRNYYVDFEAFRKLAPRAKAASAKPKDARAQAEYAAALLVGGKGAKAQAAAQRALELDKRDKLALYVLARAALARRKRGEARALLERLIAAGGDGYFARVSLGRIALHDKKLPAARRHLDKAKRFDPEQGRPYQLLAGAYERSGKIDEAIAQLKHLAYLEQQKFQPVGKLVKLLVKKKDYAGVRKYGRMAFHIHPALAQLHQWLADAYLAAAPKRRPRRAIWHLELALACKPKKPAEVHRQLAALYRQLGNAGKAARHLRAARGK